MKKITLLLVLFSSAASQAQGFPAPYCAIADADEVSVEEISAVNINGLTIINSNTADPLVDFTGTVVPVVPGQAYTLQVFGNTYGNFDTSIVAFIDWNGNGILDDAGEIYEVGTLTDSDGSDGTFVTADITVPATAAAGTVRVRITKTYTDEESIAIVDPCAISFDAFGFGAFPGYGQAVDLSLSVGSLGTQNFDMASLSIYPVPAKNTVTISYKAAIGSLSVYNQAGQEIHAGSGLGPKTELDVSQFAAGIYFLRLSSGQETQTVKIIKE